MRYHDQIHHMLHSRPWTAAVVHASTPRALLLAYRAVVRGMYRTCRAGVRGGQ